MNIVALKAGSRKKLSGNIGFGLRASTATKAAALSTAMPKPDRTSGPRPTRPASITAPIRPTRISSASACPAGSRPPFEGSVSDTKRRVSQIPAGADRNIHQENTAPPECVHQ
jgi:hypothetical protein